MGSCIQDLIPKGGSEAPCLGKVPRHQKEKKKQKIHRHMPIDEADRTNLMLEGRVELCKHECTVFTWLPVRPLRELIGPTVWRISNIKSEPFYLLCIF